MNENGNIVFETVEDFKRYVESVVVTSLSYFSDLSGQLEDASQLDFVEEVGKFTEKVTSPGYFQILHELAEEEEKEKLEKK